jgi:hypothetical protein
MMFYVYTYFAVVSLCYVVVCNFYVWIERFLWARGVWRM